VCGRKKLPFAEYSIVKECVVEAAAGRLVSRPAVERRAVRRASLQTVLKVLEARPALQPTF
jgi:hypothetical protein